MFDPSKSRADQVELLLRNAELRDELERYFDESISRVNIQHLPLHDDRVVFTMSLRHIKATRP